jgi:hypothetical protein
MALQSVEYRTERRRLSISLCFPGYQTEPLDRVVKYIDAADPALPQAAWLDELRRALDLPMGWVVFDRDDRDYQSLRLNAPPLRAGDASRVARRPRIGVLYSRLYGFVIACSSDQAPRTVGPGRPVRR